MQAKKKHIKGLKFGETGAEPGEQMTEDEKRRK
jgi:hypothetical protein